MTTHSDPLNDFQNWFDKIRIDLGYTNLDNLAHSAGLSHSLVRNLRNGKQYTLKTIDKINSVLELPTDELLKMRRGLDDKLGLVSTRPTAKSPPSHPSVKPPLNDRWQQTERYFVPALPEYALEGRDQVIGRIKQLLLKKEDAALFSFYGLPGVGKSALAVALAHDREILQEYSGGVLWASLGNKTDKSGLMNIWGKWGIALGIPENIIDQLSDIKDRAERVLLAIGTRKTLIVLDDVWQYDHALALQAGGPNTAHIITTRLSDVATQFSGKNAIAVQELTPAQGVALLERLAPQAVQYERRQAWRLVRAVGGLPLAIILMGKYLNKDSHHSHPRRLSSALESLKEREKRLKIEQPQSLLDHHPSLPADVPISLWAAIGLSYEALDKDLCTALQCLSVFPSKPNSFSEHAALEISQSSVQVLDSLVDSCIVEYVGEERYTIHQTLVDYARVTLKDKEPYERFVDYFANYTETNANDYQAISHENDNIIAALAKSHAKGKNQTFVRGVNTYYPYANARGLYSQVRSLLEQAENIARSLPDKIDLINVLHNFGKLTEKQGDPIQAEKYLEEGLDLARMGRNKERIIALIRALGIIAGHRDVAKAEGLFREGLKLARGINHQEHVSAMLTNLGWVLGSQGRYADAEDYLEKGLNIAEGLGAAGKELIIAQRINLGWVASRQDKKDLAEQHLQRGLEIAKEIGQNERICLLYQNLSDNAADEGDLENSEKHLRKGLKLARKSGHHENTSSLLSSLGVCLNRRGTLAEAEEKLIESLTIAREIRNTRYIIVALCGLGQLYLKQNKSDLTPDILQEALELAEDNKAPELEAETLYLMSQLAQSQGNDDEAIRLGRESLAIFDKIGHYQADEVKQYLENM